MGLFRRSKDPGRDATLPLAIERLLESTPEPHLSVGYTRNLLAGRDVITVEFSDRLVVFADGFPDTPLTIYYSDVIGVFFDENPYQVGIEASLREPVPEELLLSERGLALLSAEGRKAPDGVAFVCLWWGEHRPDRETHEALARVVNAMSARATHVGPPAVERMRLAVVPTPP